MSLKVNILILILLPVIIKASVFVDIRIEFDENTEEFDVDIDMSGETRRIINDENMRHFSMTQERLRNGVQALAGSRPDHVFLHDPTGVFGNQFQLNGWEPTTAVLTPHSFNVIETNSYHSLQDTQYFLNTLDQDIQKRSEFSTGTIDLTKNSWVNVPRGEQNTPIDYRIRLWLYGARFFRGHWGVREETIRSQTFNASATLTLPADTDLHSDLYDWRVKARVAVVYKSTLRGKVVGYWRRGHSGRAFWAYDVNDVLSHGGMPSAVQSEETITMDYSFATIFSVRYGNHTEQQKFYHKD